MTDVVVVGDGLVGHLIVHKLVALGRDVAWSRGRTPTLPPVALLHRHVGRSFLNEAPEQAAWQAANEWARSLPKSVAKPLTMFRPTSNDSRLSATFDSLSIDHVTEVDVAEYPFLSPCQRLFRYDDAWALDLKAALDQMHSDNLEQLPPADSLVRDGVGWSVQCGDLVAVAEHVIIAAGMGTNGLLHGLPLRSRPGELAVVTRPAVVPPNVGVSRNGHMAPTPDGKSVCVGATYRERGATTRPAAETTAECLDGIARSVPSLTASSGLGTWFGVRAVVHPDRRPLAGPTDLANLWLATGLASKGTLWAARVAQIVCDCIQGKEAPEATDPRRVGVISLAET